MDILRKVLYILTFPVWYVLSLLAGSRESPPAIEGSSNEKYPLPPIEKFSADDSNGNKPDDKDIVKAFGEDLTPAHFIDDEDEEEIEEEDGEEGEEDEEEILEDEGADEVIFNNSPEERLPNSMKKATDSLQREIEETMKLRDELIAAADRNLQQVDAMSAGANGRKAAEEVSDQPQTIVGNIARGVSTASDAVKGTAAEAERTAQEKVDRVIERSGEIAAQLAKQTSEAGASLSRSFQEELEDAQRRAKSDKETSERMKAVEQAIKENSEEE